MEILAHRGVWGEVWPSNSLSALTEAGSLGFGLELDVRDRCGAVVISHDPPQGDEPELADVLRNLPTTSRRLPFAVNVKADGLAGRIAAILADYDVEDAFCFDMSVPDALDYLERGMSCFTRISEFESEPALLSRSAGVWVDCFTTDSSNPADIQRFLALDKRVCLVSPELHGRDPFSAWAAWREWPEPLRESLMICTDRPTEAVEFFS